MPSVNVEIVEEEEIAPGKYRTLIMAIPEIGLVGILAARKLIEDLKMRRVGYISSEALSLIFKYEDGKPEPLVRLYAHDNFLVLLYEAPPDSILPVADFVAKFVEEKGISQIIMLASAPNPVRMEKSEEDIIILAAPLGDDAEGIVKQHNLKKLLNGVLSGPYALILNKCYKSGKNALVLLAETFHVPIVDPASAAALLKVLSKILGVEDKVNIRELIEKGEEIKLQMRKLEEAMKTPTPKEIGMLYT